MLASPWYQMTPRIDMGRSGEIMPLKRFPGKFFFSRGGHGSDGLSTHTTLPQNACMSVSSPPLRCVESRAW